MGNQHFLQGAEPATVSTPEPKHRPPHPDSVRKLCSQGPTGGRFSILENSRDCRCLQQVRPQIPTWRSSFGNDRSDAPLRRSRQSSPSIAQKLLPSCGRCPGRWKMCCVARTLLCQVCFSCARCGACSHLARFGAWAVPVRTHSLLHECLRLTLPVLCGEALVRCWLRCIEQ